MADPAEEDPKVDSKGRKFMCVWHGSPSNPPATVVVARERQPAQTGLGTAALLSPSLPIRCLSLLTRCLRCLALRTSACSTLDELSKHSDRSDVWMTIHGKVYNVTKYLEDHPGGEEVLLERAGKDATEDYEDVGHSNEARKALNPLEVGELPPSEKAKLAESSSSGGGGGGGGLAMAIPVLLVAIGAGYYYYSTNMA